MTYLMAVTLVSLLVAHHAEILTAPRIVEAAMDGVTLNGGPYDGVQIDDPGSVLVTADSATKGYQHIYRRIAPRQFEYVGLRKLVRIETEDDLGQLLSSLERGDGQE